MRDRLIELILNAPKTDVVYGNIKLDKPIQTAQTVADYLLANGVVVVDTSVVSPKNRPLITKCFDRPIDEVIESIVAYDKLKGGAE